MTTTWPSAATPEKLAIGTISGVLLIMALALGSTISMPLRAAGLDDFWSTPRKGGNSFNETPPDETYFRALTASGASWVRLTFSKWPSAQRDFLIGNADAYAGLVPEDLAILQGSLDAAHTAGLKVVIVPLSLPGARWAQHNGGRFDDRLWSVTDYAGQAERFWRDLAAALANHPAIAAYNLVNEPAPEKIAGLAEDADPAAFRTWQASVAGTPRDLPAFYDRLVAAIRQVDPVTPVMVDAGWYASARALAAWPSRLADDRILYAVHMYEPYEATSSPNMKRAVPWRYPGPVDDASGNARTWDRAAVTAHVGSAFDWARSQGLPASRVVVAEFGCMRRWADCATYLSDVIDAVDARGGHWAFYAFREDAWDGMDYELPSGLMPGQFYWRMEQGQADTLPRDGALMELLRARMQP